MSIRSASAVAVLVAASFGVAIADVPPPPKNPPAAPDAGAPEGPPSPRPAIAHAYLKSLVGTWALDITGGGQTNTGTSTFTLALGGTAVVEELDGSTGFSGLGVHYVTADGKGLASWWFDTMGQGQVWEMKGALEEKRYTLSGDGGPMGKMESSMSTAEGGHLYEMSMGGQKVLSIRYRDRKDPGAPTAVAREKGPKSAWLDAVLGAHVLEGVTVLEAAKVEMRHTGNSTFRLAVGGAYVVQDYEAKSDVERNLGFLVTSIAADGKTFSCWGFWNAFDGPMVTKGPFEGEGFSGEVQGGPMKGMKLAFRKVEGGYEMTGATELPGVGPLKWTETYKRAAK